MPLFTSNFKSILKIIGIFLALFAGYNLFLAIAKPQVSLLQHQWQDNIVAAQHYIYAPPPSTLSQSIIVGSSLAVRMDKDILQEHRFYNLALGGDSPLTGLMIIKSCMQKGAQAPKAIYIEENTLFMRDYNKEMIDNLFNPALYTLRKYLPSLLEKYQPLNLIYSALYEYSGLKNKSKWSEQRDERVYEMNMQNFLRQYDEPLTNYTAQLTQLQNLVAFFENNGVKVVFFQMPIDARLAHKALPTQQHALLKQYFGHIAFMPPPEHSQYVSSDGIHLLPKSALDFTQSFLTLAH